MIARSLNRIADDLAATLAEEIDPDVIALSVRRIRAQAEMLVECGE